MSKVQYSISHYCRLGMGLSGRAISWREKMKRKREMKIGQPDTELPKD